jgi:hypothetical protein
MMKYSLGPINRVLLAGGETLLFRLAFWAKETGFDVRVISAPRHAKESITENGAGSLKKIFLGIRIGNGAA